MVFKAILRHAYNLATVYVFSVAFVILQAAQLRTTTDSVVVVLPVWLFVSRMPFIQSIVIKTVTCQIF